MEQSGICWNSLVVSPSAQFGFIDEDFDPDVGLDPKSFSWHSFRSGGASSAANGFISDRMFKRHGRWRSENAKDGYVEDSLESRFAVSMSLGL